MTSVAVEREALIGRSIPSWDLGDPKRRRSRFSGPVAWSGRHTRWCTGQSALSAVGRRSVARRAAAQEDSDLTPRGPGCIEKQLEALHPALEGPENPGARTILRNVLHDAPFLGRRRLLPSSETTRGEGSRTISRPPSNGSCLSGFLARRRDPREYLTRPQPSEPGCTHSPESKLSVGQRNALGSDYKNRLKDGHGGEAASERESHRRKRYSLAVWCERERHRRAIATAAEVLRAASRSPLSVRCRSLAAPRPRQARGEARVGERSGARFTNITARGVRRAHPSHGQGGGLPHVQCVRTGRLCVL